MKTLNKKIWIISIGVVIILLILLFPKVDELNDGGTKIYKSCTYEITKVHKIKEDSLNEFYEGIIVKIFGKEVYNNLTKDVKIVVDGKEPVTTNKRYEKNIDNITLSLTIPDNWKYEELERNTENDFYKYALKIYKDNEDKYAVLYYYQQMFGVCGTGRTTKQIELENGLKVTIGYYYEKDIWEDISFYETNKSIAIINYGLDKEESEEVINFVKTINITENNNKNVEWNEINESGVNEDLLLQNIDINLLKEIARNLQGAIEEEVNEERENPELVLTEGWARIFNKEGYKNVINIGKPAMKPLYYILYKSPNNSLYEYLCATALQEISGIGYQKGDSTYDWNNAKEYLEIFTKEIIKNKEK